MRLPTLLLVVLLAVIAAFVTFRAMTDAAPSVPIGIPTVDTMTLTGRPAAFHLDLSAAERATFVRRNIGMIASERAASLGALKDDIALCADAPEVVDIILDRLTRHRGEGRAAEAAFGDLFILIRNPRFVEPIRDLLRSEDGLVAQKGLQAARTQATPDLTADVGATWRRLLETKRDSSIGLRLNALDAGHLCGGPAWPAFVKAAIGDPEQEVSVFAIDLIGSGDDPDLVPILAAVDPKDRRRTLHALAARHRLGDSTADAGILAMIDPLQKGTALEAAGFARVLRIPGAVDRIRARMAEAEGEVKRSFQTALLGLGDDTLRVQLEAEALGSDPDRSAEALMVLCGGGCEAAVPTILRGVELGGIYRTRAIGAGIGAGWCPAFLPVARRLLVAPLSHPSDIGEAVRAAGVALVPNLEPLLAKANDDMSRIMVIGWLGIIGGPEVRALLVRERGRIGRLADEQIRLLDLEARKRGVDPVTGSPVR